MHRTTIRTVRAIGVIANCLIVAHAHADEAERLDESPSRGQPTDTETSGATSDQPAQPQAFWGALAAVANERRSGKTSLDADVATILDGLARWMNGSRFPCQDTDVHPAFHLEHPVKGLPEYVGTRILADLEQAAHRSDQNSTTDATTSDRGHPKEVVCIIVVAEEDRYLPDLWEVKVEFGCKAPNGQYAKDFATIATKVGPGALVADAPAHERPPECHHPKAIALLDICKPYRNTN